MEQDTIREQMRVLLNTNKPKVEGKELWIWGTGNTAKLYQEGLGRLEKENKLFIQGYCNNNASDWGKTFFGKPIISPDKLKEKENVCVLICSPQSKIIQALDKQLKEMGKEHYLLDEVILKGHEEEILECYDSLYDEESKRIYAHIIECHLCGRYPSTDCVSGNAYLSLPPFAALNEEEIFVDCGAFVGDTIERYIEQKLGVFKKVIAFEPDCGNYKALEYRVERLKREWNKEKAFSLYPYGVGEKSGNGVFESYENGLGSKFIEDATAEESCKIVSLDEYIKEPYSFLKADIESYEYKMLRGAEKGIKLYKPLLTICIYHNAVDIYSILLLIKSFVPQYKFAVRHHSVSLAETVLYAWVED